MLGLPDFVRPAEQSERDIAGATQRRLEASLHRYWLGLAEAKSKDWWNGVVPTSFRTAASRSRRGAKPSSPMEMISRLPFDVFVGLFEATFPTELADVFGLGSRRHAFVVELLIEARDAAGHTGRPYLAVAARMTAAIAWELIQRIPTPHHDPPDQLHWLASQEMAAAESFSSDGWDVSTDCLLSPELFATIRQLVTTFKPVRESGDGGFSAAIEDVIGSEGLNLFMKAGELTLGTGLPAFSGLFHEHDLGVIDGPQLVVLELKHRSRGRVSKDDLLLFNQKTLDFDLALIRAGTRARVVRVFVTNDQALKDSLRAFCVQWGIILVDPLLPPIPVLISAFRDFDGTSVAKGSAGFDAGLIAAERLGRAMRPLDRILVPSNLSSWRRLVDAGAFPTGPELDQLVGTHHALTKYALTLLGAMP